MKNNKRDNILRYKKQREKDGKKYLRKTFPYVYVTKLLMLDELFSINTVCLVTFLDKITHEKFGITKSLLQNYPYGDIFSLDPFLRICKRE